MLQLGESVTGRENRPVSAPALAPTSPLRFPMVVSLGTTDLRIPTDENNYLTSQVPSMNALPHRERSGRSRGRTETISRYTTLVFHQAYAELRAESERTYIGYLWWIIDPIVSMLVYYLVFDVILTRGVPDFAVFLFVGLVPWRWFQTAVMSGASSILNARGIMLQVYLPKVVFPLVAFLTNTVKFLLIFVVMVVLLPFFGFPVGWSHLAIVVILVTHALFIVGVALIAAAVTPFFPDFRMVLDNAMRLWFFLSAIFFQLSDLSPQLRFYIGLNPMANVIESYRKVLMLGHWPDLTYLIGVGVVGSLLIVCGAAVIARYEYVYPRLSP